MTNTRNFYKMNKESMEKVVAYFTENTTGTAKEIGVSPSFMRSLCDRNFFRVTEKVVTGYFPVGEGLFRQSTANIYAPCADMETLCTAYTVSMLNEGNRLRNDATLMIAEAQRKLQEAQEFLSFNF